MKYADAKVLIADGRAEIVDFSADPKPAPLPEAPAAAPVTAEPAKKKRKK